MNFLIVEDDTVASIELECILEELGHGVAAVAVSPVFAQAALKDHEIDAVIFGATLVGLPPYALAETLSKRGVPHAVSSNHSEEFTKILGFSAPFLPKPYRSQDVASFIESFGTNRIASAA